MNSRPGSGAYYENGRKGNKEDIAFITLARGHVTFDKLTKKCPPPPKKTTCSRVDVLFRVCGVLKLGILNFFGLNSRTAV
jgi:hypothetical protein